MIADPASRGINNSQADQNLELAIETAGPYQRIRGHVDDLSELSGLFGPWTLDFRQIDPGPSPAELIRISGPGILLQRSRFGRRYDQRGESPAGYRTFGFLERDVEGVSWCGSDFRHTDVAIFREEGDFEAISQPGFGCWTLSVCHDQLEEAARTLGAPAGPWLRGAQDQLVAVDPVELGQLRHRLERLVGGIGETAHAQGTSTLDRDFSFGLLLQVAATFASATGPARQPLLRDRDLAVARARSFIEDHAGEPLSVRELRRNTGVSRRTLDYAFREHYDATPTAYLKAIRLNNAREMLSDASAGALVVAVANRAGFWHIGQFAADYRRHFGELPSETMRRAIGRNS